METLPLFFLRLIAVMIAYLLFTGQYIDPGAGSYFFQILISAILAGLFYGKNLVKFFRHKFSRSFSKDEKTKA